MATWPANGDTNWNTSMLAFLAVSFNTDGTLKSSIFGLSAYTNLDSDGNAMLKAHAYKAATDGWISARITNQNNKYLRGYVGSTDDPAGAGNLIQEEASAEGSLRKSLSLLVAKDEYFEITYTGSNTPTIWWKSFGSLSKPIDQD